MKATPPLTDEFLVLRLRRLAQEDPSYTRFAALVRTWDELHQLLREVEDDPVLFRELEIVVRRVTEVA